MSKGLGLFLKSVSEALLLLGTCWRRCYRRTTVTGLLWCRMSLQRRQQGSPRYILSLHSSLFHLRMGCCASILVLNCKPSRLGEGVRKVPKVVMRGCKRSVRPRERKASCTGAKWGYTGAKQGFRRCKRLLGDLSSLGPKDLSKRKVWERARFIFCAKLWYAPNSGSKRSASFIRCAEGIFAKGILEGIGVPFSSGKASQNSQVSAKGGIPGRFPIRKGKPLYLPKSP